MTTLPPTPGLHHVTALATDPRRNARFFTEVLGLRLVKRTVNYEDRFTYHLYYGDRTGTPGTVLTFFPYPGDKPGRPGAGQVGRVAFAVPEGSLSFWTDRFADHGVEFDDPTERAGERVLAFRDPDGLPLELVETDVAGETEPWDATVPAEHAIRSLYGVTLSLLSTGATADLLGAMGYEEQPVEGGRRRFRTDGPHATVVDLAEVETRALSGTGTVHHVAFRVPDEDTLFAARDLLTERDLYPTPQRDRNYFRSVYAREPGGVLFEFATDGPGFTLDEPVEELGGSLQLPPQFEEDRATIESQLTPLGLGVSA